MRLAIAAAIALGLGAAAPMQCTHDPDPSLRREDTADDALWSVAHDLDAHGDHEGARRTLEVLLERYPASRHAMAARDLLDGGVWDDARDGG